MKSNFEIWAHRGLHKDFPENSLEAVQAAISAGIKKIELDVWLHEKELVLSHDEPSGKHPHLVEVLEAADGKAEIYLELKHEPSALEVVSLINSNYKKHIDTVIFASFDVDALRAVREASPSARLALNYRGIDNDFIDIAEKLKVEYVAMNWKRLLPNYFNLKQARRAIDVKILAYTVNLPCLKRFVRVLGIDGIFTDKPNKFLI